MEQFCEEELSVVDDNVVQLPGTSRGEVPITVAKVINPDNVLMGAVGHLDLVVIVGIDEDGDLYLAANDPTLSTNTFLLQRAINKFIEFSEVNISHGSYTDSD